MILNWGSRLTNYVCWSVNNNNVQNTNNNKGCKKKNKM